MSLLLTVSQAPRVSPASSLDLGTLVRPAAPARPIAGTTLLVSATRVDGSTLMTVPVAAATPAPFESAQAATAGPVLTPATLGKVSRGDGLQLRSDGTVLALALETVPGTERIASWNLRTNGVVWLTPDTSNVTSRTPTWSPDGSLLYYASSRGTTDIGIWRIRADGTQNTLLRRPDGTAANVFLQGLTPDAAGLVWSYTRAGGSVAVFDLVTGTDRLFDDTLAASATAWRNARPRALVTVGGGAGQPPAQLVLWDDISGTKKTLLGPGIAGSPDGVYGADFDPTGTRIVIAAYSRIGGIEGSALNLIDLNGASRTVIAGTEGAQQVLWFRAGIVFTRRTATGGTDILLIQPSGGTPVILYSAPGEIGKLQFVSP